MSSPNDRLVSELEENFKKIIHSLRQVPSSRISSSAPLRTDSDQTGISRKIQDKPGAYSTLTRNVQFIADKIVEPFTKLQNLSSAHIIATQSHPHPIPAPVTAPSNPPLFNVSRPPPLRKPPFRPKTFLSSSARKITQIREDRKKGIITCYRCGEKNHSSRDCRNAIVCFECGRLGHRSRQCNTTKTLIPVKTHHPSKSTHSMATKTYDAFSVLELKSNDTNKAFPIPNFRWIARSIPNDRYLIDPPNPIWRATTIEFGDLDLGGIRFKVEAYNTRKHDHQGHPPIPFWIKIRGLPHRLFKPEEFQKIAQDLGGGTLLDVDPRSGYHLDFNYVRLKIGVCDKETIPEYRKVKFTDENGMVSFHILKFEIEEELDEVFETHTGLGPDNDNKRKFFWQMKESLDPPFHRNQSQESQHNQPSKKGRIEHDVNNNQHQHKANNEPIYQNQEPQNEIIEIEDLPYSSPKLIPKSQSPTHSSTEISSFQNLAIVTYSPTHNTPLQKSNEKDEGQQAPTVTP
jgi:Domain of unknown function (DUF4283)/Zinc knuckle